MPNARFFKICAVCSAAGALLALIVNVIHPDLPIDVREAHLLIASRGDWRATHLGIIAAALLLSYGFIGLALACRRDGPGVEVFAVVSLMIGASVLAVSIGIDGFAEKTLSDAWAHAPAGQQTGLLIAATPIQMIHVGLFYIWAGLYWGLSFVLFGWAMLNSRAFPAWFSWTAAVGGFLVSLATAAQYLAPHDSVEISLRILLFAESLWTMALGWFMWRRPWAMR